MEARLPFDPQSPPVEDEPRWERAAPPPEAEVARRVAAAQVKGPGIVPDAILNLPQAFSRAQFERFCRTNVRAQRQAGYAAVTVRLPMGDLTGAQFRVLADLALAYGDGSVRATLQQNLVMRWVRQRRSDRTLPAPASRGSGPRGRRHDRRRDELSGRGVVPAGGHPVARARTRVVGVYRLAPGPGRDCARTLRSRSADAPTDAGSITSPTFGFQGGLHRLEDGRVIPQYQLMIGGEAWTARPLISAAAASRFPPAA